MLASRALPVSAIVFALLFCGTAWAACDSLAPWLWAEYQQDILYSKVLDDSGKLHNATAYNVVLNTTSHIQGSASYKYPGNAWMRTNQSFKTSIPHAFCSWVTIHDVTVTNSIFLGVYKDSSNYVYFKFQPTSIYLYDGTNIGIYAWAPQPNVWYLVCYSFDGAASSVYVNDTLMGSFASDFGAVGDLRVDVGALRYGSPNYFFNGHEDLVMFFNHSLTAANISSLYNAGIGCNPMNATVPPIVNHPIINWNIYPPPTNDTMTNTSRTFFYNLTGVGANYCELRNKTGVLAFNSSKPQVVGKKLNLTATNLSEQKYRFVIRCLNGTGWWNSSTKILTVDLTSPSIALNPNNFFLADGSSAVNQYSPHLTVLLNFSVTDNFDVSAVIVNLTCGGIQKFSYINLSLPVGTTKFVFDQWINASDWPPALCKTLVIAADRHTRKSITDYSVKTSGLNTLEFKTEEGNLVRLSSPGAWRANAVKLFDRYTMNFDYLLPQSSPTFVIECSGLLDYYPESHYFGHFRCWNEVSRRGNWIDLEPLRGSIKVSFDGPHRAIADIILPKSVGSATLHSIGGLNVNNASFFWYRGNLSQDFSGIVAVGTPQLFRVNASRNSTLVLDLSASLVYNASSVPVTRTLHDTYAEFVGSVNVPRVAGIFNFTWTFNVGQVGGTSYKLTLNGSQQVEYAVLNISLFDEENGTVIGETATIYLSGGGISTQVSTSTGVALAGSLQLGRYRVEAETSTYPRRGLWKQVSGTTNFLRLYLVKERSGNAFIDYFLLTSSQEPIMNATWSFYKAFNLTEFLMAQYLTDYAGQVQLFQDQQFVYRVTINKSGYPLKNFLLQPIQTSYTVTLRGINDYVYKNVFEGVRTQIIPQERTLNRSNKWYNVTFAIAVDDLSLEYFGILLDNHSYTCLPASCLHNVSSSSGGLSKVRLMLNHTGTFDMHFFFKRNGFRVQFVNERETGVLDLQALKAVSVESWMAALRAQLGTSYSTGRVTASFIAAVLTVVLMALASQLGIYGLGLAVVALLCTAGFTLMNYIPKTVGFITVIAGAAAYLMLSRDE